MKKLEELGISPAPWRITYHGEVYSQDGFIFGIKTVELGCRVVFTTEPDARLIAAAPELYEALREAVKSYCEGCNDFVNGDQVCDPCECPARKWRAALAKASGESEEVK